MSRKIDLRVPWFRKISITCKLITSLLDWIIQVFYNHVSKSEKAIYNFDLKQMNNDSTNECKKVVGNKLKVICNCNLQVHGIRYGFTSLYSLGIRNAIFWV